MGKGKEIVVKVMPTGDGAGGSILTYYIPAWRVMLGRLAPILCGALGLLMIGAGIWTYQQKAKIRAVKADNMALKTRIESMDLQVDGLSRVLNRIELFDARLRKVTMLSDPARNLAMGPVGELSAKAGLKRAGFSAASLKRDLLGARSSHQALDLLKDRVELLGEESGEAETSVRQLEMYLEDQQALLSSTPSLKPVRGWRTSSFGHRVDPYTGLKQMHSGVDIAADQGKEIMAPGDGLITYASLRGAYGNVIMIDHGNKLTTLYAHMQEFTVKVGDRVKRGTLIGRVGNTGRSTGPHLHYEIRLNGVPQNPDRFILE
jgi:murein DD-endopeptidase MepM/ murein hydrolase activator NlpD